MRAGSYHASPGGHEFRQVCTRLADEPRRILPALPAGFNAAEGAKESRCDGTAVAGTGAVNSKGRHDRKGTMEFIPNQIATCGQSVGAAASRLASGPARAIQALAGRLRPRPARLGPRPARLASSMVPRWPGGWRPASPHARSSAVCMPMCPGSTNGGRGKRCRHRAPCCSQTGEYRTANTTGSRPVLYQARPDGVDQS